MEIKTSLEDKREKKSLNGPELYRSSFNSSKKIPLLYSKWIRIGGGMGVYDDRYPLDAPFRGGYLGWWPWIMHILLLPPYICWGEAGRSRNNISKMKMALANIREAPHRNEMCLSNEDCVNVVKPSNIAADRWKDTGCVVWERLKR